MGGVYLSFDRADRGYAARLTKYFTVIDVPCAYGEGKNTDDHQRAARIQASDVVVVVMSDSSAASERVAQEIAWAHEYGKRLMPLLLSGTPFLSLAALTYEDVSANHLPRQRFIQELTARVGAAKPRRMTALRPALLCAAAVLNGTMALLFWADEAALWTFLISALAVVLAGWAAVSVPSRLAQRLCVLAGFVAEGSLVVATARWLLGDQPSMAWFAVIFAGLGALGLFVGTGGFYKFAEQRIVGS